MKQRMLKDLMTFKNKMALSSHKTLKQGIFDMTHIMSQLRRIITNRFRTEDMECLNLIPKLLKNESSRKLVKNKFPQRPSLIVMHIYGVDCTK